MISTDPKDLDRGAESFGPDDGCILILLLAALATAAALFAIRIACGE